ncbi:HesA/MoeB/ThiF family protein [Moraxella sp. FZFQ2102]|uniref:HesA/MoeB/ThiF family protein n=1 Tax=Moraxella sp. FZFQ2102 TaxID=2953752 RepID=UPI00209BC878|nr:HesA/MoeB/ThiF family protein [Moraxella sp. FZFQ2102]USZ14941.1 HesA/MoeB/ThiF family protein [Moraxella sp. FZFQ2102]
MTTADALSDDELMRYSRQILLDDWDIDAQICLKNSHAIIVGMGGLGCPVAQTLARAGVGQLTLIDDDAVDISNLQRQSLYTTLDIGKPKSVCAKSALSHHNEYTAITTITERISADNICKLIGKADLVIDCTDNFAVRDLLNRYTRSQNLPLLSTSAIAQVGQIALYTEQTGCYRCVFGDDDGDEMTCATSGVLASTVAVIGAMAAQVALDFLGRGVNPIAGKLLLWQGATLSLKQLSFSQDANCPVCSAE